MNNLKSIFAKLETQKQNIHAVLEQKKQFVFLNGTPPDGKLFADLQAVEWSIQQVQAQIESESSTNNQMTGGES